MGFRFIRRQMSYCDFVTTPRKNRTMCRGLRCTAACSPQRKMQDYEVQRVAPPEPEKVEMVEG